MIYITIMRTKNLLIIAVILVVIAGLCVVSYSFLSATSYKNITMDGVSMEVRDCNVSVMNQTDRYFIYNDTGNGITILLFDSTGSDLSDSSEMLSFAGVRDANQIEAKLENDGNISYNYSETLKVYTYLTNYTHRNVFIMTEDRDDMKHILSTLKVGESLLKKNETNETNNTTSSTPAKKSSTRAKKTTEREEDKVTPDGWNPKEHEVSREDLGDGNQKVRYDDGYMRVVNKKGDVLTYGFG